jgi:alcohol dehydrogenase (cytochrome c)
MFDFSVNAENQQPARCRPASTAVAIVLALISLSTTRMAIAADGTDKPSDWPLYHGNSKSWRYSELDQINKSNVKRLKVAWIHQPGDITGGLQATPIVIDGVLYYISANNKVQALDAASGKELWRYETKLDPVASEVFFSVSSRGVTVAGGKVYLGTLDGRVIALDQKTGKELWATQLLDTRKKKGANFTSPPTLAGTVLVAGPTGGDIGQRGQIYGIDAETGKRLWEFDTIRNDQASWPGNSGDTGGGSAWLPGTYDAETDTVYIGTGNPAPDYYGDDRKGDNLYTSTLLALDAKTGKPKWHHQEIPHDVWDFDSPYESILFERDGKKLLLHPNKSGYAFLYERNNGKLVNVWPYIENINFVEKIDPTTGELIGRNEPVAGKESYICPTLLGGRSWNPGAFNPTTGLWYTNRFEACNTVVAGKSDPEKLPLAQLYFGVDSFKITPPRGKEASAWLDAIDPMTGKKKWSVRYSMPGLGGVLATAGGLVFNGDITGVVSAYDADEGDVLWNFYAGSGVRGGIVSYSAGGKQYIVVPTGLGSHAVDFLPAAFPDLRKVNGGSALIAFTVD